MYVDFNERLAGRGEHFQDFAQFLPEHAWLSHHLTGRIRRTNWPVVSSILHKYGDTDRLIHPEDRPVYGLFRQLLVDECVDVSVSCRICVQPGDCWHERVWFGAPVVDRAGLYIGHLGVSYDAGAHLLHPHSIFREILGLAGRIPPRRVRRRVAPLITAIHPLFTP